MIAVYFHGFLDPPEIEYLPQSQAVKSGGTAAFYCYAAGEPTPSFTWKKNGKKLRYTDSRSVVSKIVEEIEDVALRNLISDFEGGSLLRIEPVRKKKEAGIYECVAENGNGDPVSVEAELTVYDGKCT